MRRIRDYAARVGGSWQQRTVDQRVLRSGLDGDLATGEFVVAENQGKARAARIGALELALLEAPPPGVLHRHRQRDAAPPAGHRGTSVGRDGIDGVRPAVQAARGRVLQQQQHALQAHAQSPPPARPCRRVVSIRPS